MPRVALLLALLFALLTAGCASSPRRTYELQVVEGPGGPPVPHATVVFEPGWRSEETYTTDEEGRLRLTGRSPWIDVRAEGYVPASFRLRSDLTPVVHIFRMHLAATINGTLAGGDVATPSTPLPDRWDPHEVPFGHTIESKREYASRLLTLNATLAWESTLLTGAGDLAIALGPSEDEILLWHDSDDAQVEPGAHREEVQLTLRDFGSGWENARGAWAGATAGKAYASPLGLPYTLTLEATFGEPRGTPALPLAALLAGLAVLALIRRRVS